MTQEMARALADAGYISVADYVALCERNGWTAK